ncbi:MAG: D-alanyl-D-alanine carboxypeptidase/D-alanyl-D-alanine-endopeptidase [Terriglobia bacterium]|jgi:D-alanyl-D-alanine carboxypeptidase/D-alanyl-D-alanine-endopeptidase (penicillin-binding protein 4)
MASALLCLLAAIEPGVAVQHRATQRADPSLAARIDQILRSSDASRGFWGVEVAELPSGRILFDRDAQHLFHPASNMKLFTTSAALEKLGPSFVFRTTVESDSGPPAQGIVPRLYLVGRGDPTLCGDVLPPPATPCQAANHACTALEDLAAQVRAHGVIEVTGPLVADESYFDFEPYTHGWTAEDLEWGYGAAVSALIFNSNALLLRIKPGLKLGDPAQLSLDPVTDYYQIKNGLVTSASGSESHLFVERALDSTRLDVWGQIPLGSGEADEHVAIAHPAELVGELFSKALVDSGTIVKGGVEVRQVTQLDAALARRAPTQASPRLVLAEHQSQPLREIAKLTNKESMNLCAEMLLRTLGRQVKQRGGLEDSLDVLNEFAQQIGARPGETVFADGSGLSRDDLVTPQTVVKLLIHMASGPSFDVFRDSLPAAGVDGTLADRFKGARLKGRIHAKTGTLEGVNALSGYMDLPFGKRLAFSIIGNSHPLEEAQAEATLDQIAAAIYDWFSRRGS